MTIQKVVRRFKVVLILGGSVAMSIRMLHQQTGIVQPAELHTNNGNTRGRDLRSSSSSPSSSSDNNNISAVVGILGPSSSSTTTSLRPIGEVGGVEHYKENFKKENLQDGPHICGAKKCMIPLKQDSSIGYLVVNARQPGNFPQRMAQAYNFSKRVIEGRYNMSHVYLDEPYETRVDSDFVQWMKKDQIGGYYGQKKVASFSVHGHWLVQPVSVVPQHSSILFGCEPKRIKDAIYNLHQMGELYFKQEAMSSDLRVVDYKSLKERVSIEFGKLFDLLHDHPCLYDDFQMFLDVSSGNIIHMDVDRCFPLKDDETKYRDVERSCLPLMKDFEGYIISKLSEFEQLYSSSGVQKISKKKWGQRLFRTLRSPHEG